MCALSSWFYGPTRGQKKSFFLLVKVMSSRTNLLSKVLTSGSLLASLPLHLLRNILTSDGLLMYSQVGCWAVSYVFSCMCILLLVISVLIYFSCWAKIQFCRYGPNCFPRYADYSFYICCSSIAEQNHTFPRFLNFSSIS